MPPFKILIRKSYPLNNSETFRDIYIFLVQKYKAFSDNAQKLRILTPPTFLTELGPFENLSRKTVSAQ